MKYIQAVLSNQEYEEFLKMAKSQNLTVKDAASKAIKTWVRHRGREFIEGTGEEIFLHPIFEKWQEYFFKDYVPPKKEILFFLNCTWGKPYHESWIFRKISEKLKEIIDLKKIHFVVVSSAGLVPQEYWDYYPFNSYDSDPWKFSPQDREAYVRINSERVSRYLKKKTSYEKIAVYLPENDSAKISVEIGYKISNCMLPIKFSKGIFVDEENREEDYYACLTYKENLKKLREVVE